MDDNEVSKVEKQFDGASFENWDTFYKYNVQLEKLEDEYATLAAVSGKDYVSFLQIAMTTENQEQMEIADQLTFGLMAILNKDLQFKVAGKIISFKDGAFYEFDKQKSSYQKIDNLEISIMKIKGAKEDMSSSKLYVSGDNTAGYSYKDFYRGAYYRCSDNVKIFGPSSRPMRFIQQLKSLRTGSTAFLFVETKLFWRNSKNKLSYAETEERNYTYNINGSVGISTFTSGGWQYSEQPINFQKTVGCTKSRWNRQQLASAFPTDGRAWSVDLVGTITHHINGDYSSNKWNAPVNWR